MSNRLPLVYALAALTLPLTLGACASTPTPLAEAPPVEMYAPPPPPPPLPPVAEQPYEQPEILAELPQNAPPGECYARVKVPGAPLPQAPGFRWVQNPGPPGSPGPIWCLEPTGPAPVAFEPDRFGFIRVLCDDQVTPDRVVSIQRKLHEGGYYEGGYTGRYDADTQRAVTRFQGAHHLNHGGYLSVDTVRAIDSAPPTVVVAPRITVKPKIIVAQPPAPPPVVVRQPVVVQQPVPVPVYQPPVYVPQPYPVYEGGHGGYSASYGGGYQSYQSGYGYQGGYGYAPPAAAAASASASAGRASAAASASAGGAAFYGQQAAGYQGYYGQGQGYYGQQSYYGGQAYYGQGYYGQGGYGQGYYGQGAWAGPYPGPYGASAAAAAWTSVGPRPAYAAPRSAIQNGWLTWDGKSYY